MTQLRPYQRRMVDEAIRALKYDTNRLIVQGPTGSGKTLVMAAITKEHVFDKRPKDAVGLLTHNVTLREQAAKAFEAFGIEVVDWTTTPPKERRFEPGKVTAFGTGMQLPERRGQTLLVDECHRSASSTWKRELALWGERIGFSATPCRFGWPAKTPTRSQAEFAQLWSQMVLGPQPTELVNLGYLARVRMQRVLADVGLDRSMLIKDASKADGYTAESMQEFELGLNLDLAIAELSRQADMPTLWFCGSAHAARDIADKLNGAYILADTPESRRAEYYSRFQAGELNHLSSVSVFSEGVDLPEASRVCLIRPSRSIVLLLQAVGRTTRPTGGDAHVWDFAGNFRQLGEELGWEEPFHPQSDVDWRLALNVAMDDPVRSGRAASDGAVHLPISCYVCNATYSPTKTGRLCTNCGSHLGSMCLAGCGSFTRAWRLICVDCEWREQQYSLERYKALGITPEQANERLGLAPVPQAQEHPASTSAKPEPMKTGVGTPYCDSCGKPKSRTQATVCFDCMAICGDCGENKYDPGLYERCYRCNRKGLVASCPECGKPMKPGYPRCWSCHQARQGRQSEQF